MSGVLGFDLATVTGWARTADGVSFDHGIIDTRNAWSEGGRFAEFRRAVDELLIGYRPNLVVFEDVRGHGKAGLRTAHLFGAYRSHLAELCQECGFPLVGCTPQDLKAHATGKRGASKDDVRRWARAMLSPNGDPKLVELSEDEADALALTLWGWMRYSSVLKDHRPADAADPGK